MLHASFHSLLPLSLFPLLVPLFTFSLHSFHCLFPSYHLFSSPSSFLPAPFPFILLSLPCPFPSYTPLPLFLYLSFCFLSSVPPSAFSSALISENIHSLPSLCPRFPSALYCILSLLTSSLHFHLCHPSFFLFFPFLSFCFSFKVQSFVHYLHYKQGWHLHKCWSQWTCLCDVSGQTAHTRTHTQGKKSACGFQCYLYCIMAVIIRPWWNTVHQPKTRTFGSLCFSCLKLYFFII